MSSKYHDFEEIIASATSPGESILPKRLLDAVTKLSQPLNFLTSFEPTSEPFDAFREDYPAVHLRRCGARSLNPEEMEQAVGLLRWVLQELAVWTRESDPRLVKMTALMVALNEFDWSDAQWSLLPATAVNPSLTKLLCDIMSNYRCEIQREPEHRASRTNDFIAALAKADSDGDWGAIAASWQQIETWLHGGLFLGQAVPCLACFDLNGLAFAMDKVPKIQTAYLVAKSLSEANRVRLARASSSWRYRFASVLSIAWGGNAFTDLDDEARNELTALLMVVSQYADQWRQWMQAFNKNPIRVPALQSALGNALAQAPEYALASYVDSISLYAWPLNGTRYGQQSRLDGRQSVAACLRTFREAATPEQRCRLWRLAHTRWQQWNFGLHSTSDRYLSGIVGSELDYAIAAHAAECLNTDERDTLLSSLVKKANDIEMSWHQSISNLISCRNSFLSRMQPLLAAGGADWLFKHPVKPSEIIENPHTQLKFRIG
jgi:hypothetical protein